MDKAKLFLYKIQSKNKLRVLLKEKLDEFEKCTDEDMKTDLADEISAIELELEMYG